VNPVFLPEEGISRWFYFFRGKGISGRIGAAEVLFPSGGGYLFWAIKDRGFHDHQVRGIFYSLAGLRQAGLE
jgi:hypothetical protein